MNVRFLATARRELWEAAEYLDESLPGLGHDFVLDVEKAVALISEFPLIGRRLDARHRSVPLQRFTYYLAYRTDSDLLTIVAIAHKRRRPGYWRQRK